MENYLELKNVALKYQTKNGETEALKNITFSVKKAIKAINANFILCPLSIFHFLLMNTD